MSKVFCREPLEPPPAAIPILDVSESLTRRNPTVLEPFHVDAVPEDTEPKVARALVPADHGFCSCRFAVSYTARNKAAKSGDFASKQPELPGT